MILPHEPVPTDLVCPVCSERVFRSNPKDLTGRTVCPNFHNAAANPIPYFQWLAEVVIADTQDGR